MSFSKKADVKRTLTLCAAFCVTTLGTVPGLAKSVTLQTVNLTDRGMSLEGGETRLYRVSNGRSIHCRIEAIHFGEMGKTIYGFAFNPRLFSAVKREYRYKHPFYLDAPLKQRLISTETLNTRKGSATLPAAFTEYRAFFDPQKLANCFRS